MTKFSILAMIAGLEEASLKQLEDALVVDQTTLTRSLNLLARDRVSERVAHADGRVKAMVLGEHREGAWNAGGVEVDLFRGGRRGV